MKYGLDLEKELSAQSEEDWVFGAVDIPDIASIPELERDRYLPAGEVQRSNVEDMFDCATRVFINILETKLNWLLKNNKISKDNLDWLKDKGYITDRGFEIADAFNAILSGTTRVGNSLRAPLDSIRKDGVVPKKLLPLKKDMRWEDYHNPSRITDDLRQMGQEFLQRFKLNYQKVLETDYAELVEKDLLAVAGYAWPSVIEGVYQRVEYDPNHAFVIFKRLYSAFDNYIDSIGNDFIKVLAPDFNFLDYGYRITINSEAVVPKHISAFSDLLRRVMRFIRDLFSGKDLGVVRDPKWRKVRSAFIKLNPKCELCQKKAEEIHHIIPVHRDKSLELVESNFISTCRACHFSFCHFFSWRSFNKDIKNDIIRIRERP